MRNGWISRGGSDSQGVWHDFLGEIGGKPVTYKQGSSEKCVGDFGPVATLTAQPGAAPR